MSIVRKCVIYTRYLGLSNTNIMKAYAKKKLNSTTISVNM